MEISGFLDRNLGNNPKKERKKREAISRILERERDKKLNFVIIFVERVFLWLWNSSF